MILILGIFECCIGCGAAASVSRMGICFFSCPPPQVSRIYYFSSRINATQYIYIFNWFVYFASQIPCLSSFAVILYLEASNVPCELCLRHDPGTGWYSCGLPDAIERWATRGPTSSFARNHDLRLPTSTHWHASVLWRGTVHDAAKPTDMTVGCVAGRISW